MPRYSFTLQVPTIGDPDNEPTNLLTCSFVADSIDIANQLAENIEKAYRIPQREPLPLRIMERVEIKEVRE